MPPNKENDEATTLEKRCNAVEAIKNKVEYILTTSLDDQPQGPDPYTKMSKRQFERAMKTWRAQLRANALRGVLMTWRAQSQRQRHAESKGYPKT